MGYVLLGHGGMDFDPMHTSPEMESIAIPRGTTIQFYTDANQVLSFDPGEPDIWKRFHAPWPPLDSSHVTYNLTLQSYNAEDHWARDFLNSQQFGGNEVFVSGMNCSSPIHLCNGTPETCPTKPEQAANGMTHQCDGILGRLHGDLYWFACALFVGVAAENRPVVEAAMGDRVRGVTLGTDPDATVSDAERQRIEGMNQYTLKYIESGDVLPCLLAGPVLLMGGGHNNSVIQRLRLNYSGDVFDGQVKVDKGGDSAPDWFDVYGVPPHKQRMATAAFNRISRGSMVQFH
ncbi:hypothetical protein [Streptomyces sp. NPDC001297]